MVILKAVSKTYFTKQRVLERIDLNLKKGDFLYLVGGSGAGKTSLLRMIATEESPSEGSVSLFGYNLKLANPSQIRLIRQSIGYIPQDIRLIPDLTVYDNVALAVSLAGRRLAGVRMRPKISDLLDQLGLAAKRDKKAQELSGGEAQRVAVARALARMPDLIIADEPTGAQDRDYIWTLMDLFIKANQQGTTVLLATHDRDIVKRVRKRAGVLRGGQLTIEEAVCIY